MKENYVLYWAYSEKLDLHYIGTKTFTEFEKFERYTTRSSNQLFRDTLSWKIILNSFPTREKALEAEVRYHKLLKVDENPLFANVGLQTSTGFSFRGIGESNPMYGLKGVDHPKYGKKHSEEVKKKQSDSLKGKKKSQKHRDSLRYPKTKEHKEKLSKAKIGKSVHCKEVYIWQHRNGRVEHMTQAGLVHKYKLDGSCISKVRRGKVRQHKGWTCIGCNI